MTKSIARVAQTKLGISFEEWKNRPVFKTHCRTYQIAARLCGLTESVGCGSRTLSGEHATALQGFRQLAAYRDHEANALRSRVARHIKELRRESALMV
ncbi:hypothetical protein [Acidovorax delafieldii]|uniref:hypothetical protein n=1 Tax=Acidovorax delafieldii TaxID=47920 RepID=UPI003ECFCE0B